MKIHVFFGDDIPLSRHNNDFTNLLFVRGFTKLEVHGFGEMKPVWQVGSEVIVNVLMLR